MNIKLNKDLYPFYPPSINFYDKFKNNLDVEIINHDYFKLENWNPTNKLVDLITNIYNILEKNCELEINSEFSKLNNIINKILIDNNLIKNNKYYNINIDFVKLTNNNTKNFWKEGTGFGSNNSNKWNINQYIKNKELNLQNNIKNINNLLKYLKLNEKKNNFLSFIKKSHIDNVILFFLEQIDLVKTESLFLDKMLYN